MGYNGITARECRNRRANGTHDLRIKRRFDDIALTAISLKAPAEVVTLFYSHYEPTKWASYITTEYLGNQQFRHHWISADRAAEVTDARIYRIDVAEDLAAEVTRRVKYRAESAGIALDANCLHWIESEIREYTVNTLRKLWLNGGKK